MLLATLLSLIAASGIVSAIPGTPNQFYGSVYNNGQLAPDGFSVSARIDSIEVSSATTENGIYSIIIKDQESILSGKTVSFFVEGTDTGKTASFCNGCIRQLDLSVAIPVPSSSQESSTGSSSAGSASSSSAPVASGAKKANDTDDTGIPGTGQETQPAITPMEKNVTEPGQEEPCIEKWYCTEWSDCKDQVRKRECIDSNRCGTEYNRPFESEPCSILEEQSKANDFAESGSPVGFASFVALVEQKNTIFIAVLAILLAIILLIYTKNVPAILTTSGKDSKEKENVMDPEDTSKKKTSSRKRPSKKRKK